MSIDIPSWGAGELMLKAFKQLQKIGWRRAASGRIDCIEKDFGEITVGTIWAGVHLLLNPRVKGDNPISPEHYIPLNDPAIEAAKNDLVPIFDRIVKRNKKRWLKEATDYAERRGIEWQGNPKYGV